LSCTGDASPSSVTASTGWRAIVQRPNGPSSRSMAVIAADEEFAAAALADLKRHRSTMRSLCCIGDAPWAFNSKSASPDRTRLGWADHAGTKAPGFSLPACGSLANCRNVSTWPPPADERRGGRPGIPALVLVAKAVTAWLPAIRAALGTISTTLVRKSAIAARPCLSRSRRSRVKSWYINGKRIVELIGPGRQAVLLPTIIPKPVLLTTGPDRPGSRPGAA
jgi:hypothetical protein